MIRHDFTPSPEGPRWVVISQVEHARISGELAKACQVELLFSGVGENSAWSSPAMAGVYDQLLAAVIHHDDGWADWERVPRIDPATGRPVAYTELTPEEAAQIWTRSVEAASRFGPLAGATVAGHFLRLLGFAEHLRDDPCAEGWQRDMLARRGEWLAEMQATNPKIPVSAMAARALQWLWTFDEISLWLCGDRPPGSGTSQAVSNYLAGRGTPLQMTLGATPELQSLKPSDADDMTTIADPWRFVPSDLQFTVEGSVVTSQPQPAGADFWSGAEPMRFHPLLRTA